MTESQKVDSPFPEQQIAKPVRTLEALLKLYVEGHRNFSGSDLRGVTVDIIDPEINFLSLQDIILSGSNLKAINLYRSTYLKVDLTGANLSRCNLQGSNLYTCILNQCNFADSDLRKANLSNASCRGSDFINAKLTSILINHNSDFTASDFTEANFKLSYLSGKFSYSKFCNTNFLKASFCDFQVQSADFSGADLEDVEFSTSKAANFQYSYYNCQTKLGNIDPISMGMELIKDDISAGD